MEAKMIFKYHVKVGNKTVARDIGNNLERALTEWQVRYPNCHLQTVGRRTTEDAANRWKKMGGRRPYKHSSPS